MKRNTGVQLDEITLDTIFEEKGIGERPLPRSIFRHAIAVALILGVLALGRVWSLGGMRGGDYRARAENALERVVVKRAARGRILDRFGIPLVENAPSLDLYLDAAEFARRGEEEGVRSALARAGMGRDEIEAALEAAAHTSDRLLVKQDVRRSDAVVVESANVSSLSVESDLKRSFGEEFAHIVGYTGLATREETRLGFSSVDLVGRTGLEAQFDGSLRGENGRVVLFKDARGGVLEERILRESESGGDLTTTIDGELQTYFYARLKETMRTLGAGPGGVGIALDPRNGEVLSLVSLPSFTPENIVDALANSRKPIFNRAVSGLYNPGSVIKTIVAIAALKEKIVTPRDRIFSAGYIEIPNPYFPEKPSRFLDWKAHGWVDLYAALARSSNVYFYAVGGGYKNLKGIGMAKLKEYYERFGLGEKTGIAIPGEATGEIPSAEEREAGGGVWRVGDTYNVSIGQGDLL
ncbi:MAG: hypothetical protein HY536_01410, partial [Candidatus Colwellbacteria bacterium]|nr:hypothetical protein [Candidatus Colwellbacteria bacterium]